MEVDFNIEGLKQVDEQLKRLNNGTRGKVVKSTLRRAAKPLESEMQSNVTRLFNAQTGELAESVKITTDLNGKINQTKYDAAVFVGINKNKSAHAAGGNDLDASVYAYWLETGVEPHSLMGKNSTVATEHPGIAPTPFIRPVLDNNADQTVTFVKTDLGKAIVRALKRQRK